MHKLEIGSGNNPTNGYVHLDVNPNAPHVEIVGDIRALFSPDYDVNKYPDLQALDTRDGEICIYDEIRAVHLIEHVQWIYQEAMFQWFYRLLDYDGRLVLQTPNLEWICKSYLKNKRRKKFPVDEHPNLHEPQHFVPWVNFKLYSGCSLGDYHHCCYDAIWLRQMLNNTGFKAKVKKGSLLHATGIKPGANQSQPIDEYYRG